MGGGLLNGVGLYGGKEEDRLDDVDGRERKVVMRWCFGPLAVFCVRRMEWSASETEGRRREEEVEGESERKTHVIIRRHSSNFDTKP